MIPAAPEAPAPVAAPSRDFSRPRRILTGSTKVADGLFDVEQILSHVELIPGDVLYKVKWEGYDEICDVSRSAFQYPTMLKAYWDSLPGDVNRPTEFR
jgi:hypothetical protein